MYYRTAHQFRSTDEVSLEKFHRKDAKGIPYKWHTLKVLVKNVYGNKTWVAVVAKEDNRMLRKFPDLEKARLMYLHVQTNFQAYFILLYPTSEYDLGARVPLKLAIDFSSSQVGS